MGRKSRNQISRQTEDKELIISKDKIMDNQQVIKHISMEIRIMGIMRRQRRSLDLSQMLT
jgi:hypothetical protein